MHDEDNDVEVDDHALDFTRTMVLVQLSFLRLPLL